MSASPPPDTPRRSPLMRPLHRLHRARLPGCIARAVQLARPAYRGAAARRRYGGAAGLTILVVSWWLALAGAVVGTLPTPASSAATGRLTLTEGVTAHVVLPGIPRLPIPVEREAFDEYHRGFRESDEAAIARAEAASDWLTIWHGLAVRVLRVDGEAVQVALLDGPEAGRQGWLKARQLSP